MALLWACVGPRMRMTRDAIGRWSWRCSRRAAGMRMTRDAIGWAGRYELMLLSARGVAHEDDPRRYSLGAVMEGAVQPNHFWARLHRHHRSERIGFMG